MHPAAHARATPRAAQRVLSLAKRKSVRFAGWWEVESGEKRQRESLNVWVCWGITTKVRDGKQQTLDSRVSESQSLEARTSRPDSRLKTLGENGYEDRKSPIIHFYFIINFITHKVKRRSRAASWWCTRPSTSMKNAKSEGSSSSSSRRASATHTLAHWHTPHTLVPPHTHKRDAERRRYNTRPFGRKSLTKKHSTVDLVAM